MLNWDAIPEEMRERLTVAFSQHHPGAETLTWRQLKVLYVLGDCWTCGKARYKHGWWQQRHLMIRKGRG